MCVGQVVMLIGSSPYAVLYATLPPPLLGCVRLLAIWHVQICSDPGLLC